MFGGPPPSVRLGLQESGRGRAVNETYCARCGGVLEGSRCPTCDPPVATAAPFGGTRWLLLLAGVAGLVVVAAVAFGIGRGLTTGGLPDVSTARSPTSSTGSGDSTTVPRPSSTVLGAPTPTLPAPTPLATSTFGTLRALPAGSWLTVLDSKPQTEWTEAAAWGAARALGYNGVTVVDSSAIPGLNGGYWAISLVGFSSRDAARAACASVGRDVGGTCYERLVQ